VPAIEIALIVILAIHIIEALLLWQQSRAARPVAYEGGKTWATNKSEKSKKNLSSTLMMWSGIIILIFIVLHVWMFKYGAFYAYSPGGGTAFVQSSGTGGLQPAGANLQVVQQAQIRDLYRLVVENFKNPLIAILYMLAMVVLGGHLYHAVWSSSQTLGATNNNWRRIMLWLGKAFAIVIAAGFFILPLWVYFFVNWTPQ
jgi:succinate dehydrogenase / fumarate reductase cytochrome b subunit